MDPDVPQIGGRLDELGPSSVRPQSWGVRGDLGTEQSPWMCSWPRCHMASRAGAAGASGEQPGMC